MADAELGRAAARNGNSGVDGEIGAGEEAEPDALEIEEGDSAVFEFGADDAFRRQVQPVAIKPDRLLKIIDAERQHGDAWFHRSLPYCRAQPSRRSRLGLRPG